MYLKCIMSIDSKSSLRLRITENVAGEAPKTY